MQQSAATRRLRNRVLAAVALGTLLVIASYKYHAHRALAAAREAPYGVTAPSSLKGPAREAWHLRGLGHQRLVERLDATLPATTQPTSEAFQEAAVFEVRAGQATISVKPLDMIAGDEQFVEMTVRVVDKSGAVLAEQAERLGVQPWEGKWRISRINVYGWED